MATVWMEFRNGGWPNWIILLLGLAGLALALACVIVAAMRSSAARGVGIAGVALAGAIAAVGLLGVGYGQRLTNRAVDSGAIRPTQAERIRREGYLEARSCAKFGLGFALLPLLAGALAVSAAPRRRNGPPPAPFGGFATPGTPTATPDGGGSSAVALSALGVATLLVLADVLVLARPLPGRPLDVSDPAWQLLDAKEEIDSGDLDEGCRDLESALERSAVSAEVDAGALAAKCADHRIDEILRGPPSERRGELETFARSPLCDEAHKKRIADEIARLEPEIMEPKLPHAAGTVKIGATQVSGRLPPEVIQRIVRQSFSRFRLCYESGLARDPKLRGRVTVRFVIGRDGSVSNVASGESTMPDKGVESCVVRAFYGLSFPEPEGGIVTVTYPIDFQPG